MIRQEKPGTGKVNEEETINNPLKSKSLQN